MSTIFISILIPAKKIPLPNKIGNKAKGIATQKLNSTKGINENNLSHLTLEQQQLIKNAETISTAKPHQAIKPRDLNEQLLWKQVQENPTSGRRLDLTSDDRFSTSAGFQKREVSHKLPDGSPITIHYQYNSNTGKSYDIKIVTPKRKVLQPGRSIKNE